MKKALTALAVLIALTTVLTSCSPLFKDGEAYNKEKWSFWADHDDVAQIRRDKDAEASRRLALAKLKDQPVMTAPASAGGYTQGYKGIIENRSTYYAYTFELKGPENNSYFLPPGTRTTTYLIPGRYEGTIKNGEDDVGKTVFDVSAAIMLYNNEPCHWFFYAAR